MQLVWTALARGLGAAAASGGVGRPRSLLGVATTRDYACQKFFMSALALANSEESLRDRLIRTLVDDLRHAHPPFDASVPTRVAERAAELFDLIRRGPQFDEEEILIKETVSLMTDEELQHVAAEIVWIYGRLATD